MLSSTTEQSSVVRSPVLALVPRMQVPGALGAFFRDNAYIVGGHRLSMDEVEHGILRCNQVLFLPAYSATASRAA